MTFMKHHQTSSALACFSLKALAVWLTVLTAIVVCGTRHQAQGEEFAPSFTGVALTTGYTYDPDIDAVFSQITLSRILDYEQVWFHDAPDGLRFKFEISLGGSHLDNGNTRVIANANIFALYYLSFLETRILKPYIEGGIGGIYTDYQVTDQAYRINFNPQAGIGCEFKTKSESDGNWYCALRAHHLSNGGISGSNRGQNSVIFMLGKYF